MRASSSERRRGSVRGLPKSEKAFRRFGLLASTVLLLRSGGAVAQDAPPPAALVRANETAGAPISLARDLPKTFGIGRSYQRVGVSEFTPADSSMTYSDAAITSSTWSRYPTNDNAFGAFVATVHLPSGALLDLVEFLLCDSSAAADVVATVQVTSLTGEGATVAASAKSSGATGCQIPLAIPADPIEIDNFGSQVLLVVNVPTHDGTTSISGAVLYYRLQVSPAPAFPTFNDVPASDFGFQFIEALAASGITGGCGNNKYCPDSPVTRRQMAIFLAKALGLYYP